MDTQSSETLQMLGILVIFIVVGIGGGYLNYRLKMKPLLDDLKKYLDEKERERNGKKT